MSDKKIKNLKISEYHHKILKDHCNKEGLKMFNYVEKLIEDNCKPKRDLYGEL
jgi:hypothetical protein